MGFAHSQEVFWSLIVTHDTNLLCGINIVCEPFWQLKWADLQPPWWHILSIDVVHQTFKPFFMNEIGERQLDSSSCLSDTCSSNSWKVGMAMEETYHSWDIRASSLHGMPLPSSPGSWFLLRVFFVCLFVYTIS